MTWLRAIAAASLLAAISEASVIQLDATSFDAAIADKSTFVKFFAPWCGHCKNLAPTWATLSGSLEEQGSSVAVASVDCTAPQGSSLCQRLQVRGYPTLKFFHDGHVYDAEVPRNKESLVAFATGGFSTAKSQPFAPEPPMTVEILSNGEAAEAKAELKRDEDADQEEDEEEDEAPTPIKPVLLVRELTDETLEHDTQAATGATTGPWLVEFYAPWCPHCKSFAPKFDKIARALARDRIPISCAKIDATENPVSARRFSVRSFPALRLLKGGRMWEYPSDKPRTVADIVDFAKGGYTRLASVPVPAPVTIFTQLQEELLQAVTEAGDIAVSKPNPAMVLSAAGFIVGMLCTTIVALGTACLLPVDGEAPISNDAPTATVTAPTSTPATPSKSARKRAAARAKATLESSGSK